MKFIRNFIFFGLMTGVVAASAQGFPEYLAPLRQMSASFRKEKGIVLPQTNTAKRVSWVRPKEVTINGKSYFWTEDWSGTGLIEGLDKKQFARQVTIKEYDNHATTIEVICTFPPTSQHMGENGRRDDVGVWQEGEWLLIADSASAEYYAAYKNITLVFRYVGKEPKPDEEMYEVLRAIVKAGLREESSKSKLEENTPAQTKENSAR